MPRLVLHATTLMILLALTGVLLMSILSFGLAAHEHNMMFGMTDCPFMVHGETLCPMTVFDHLTMMRDIFEITIASLTVLSLVAGVALLPFLFTPKQKPFLYVSGHTFWRWRQFVIYHFSHRQHQQLFSEGILHPKLF